jgi:transcriptional regulator with XRE-family HTH domain
MRNRIKQLRTEAGMKQEELAKLLNLDKSQISRYETGKQDISTDTLAQMSVIFGCTTGYILGVDENKNVKEIDKMVNDLKGYQKAAIMAKESGISPEALEEQIQLLRKIFGNKN